ncbi:MAG: glycosyltransferase involved in cell wall biosynthesis [Planctomycetota bacterium]|jgi:glycosyltransferase involved in cell wall biosynthesis
MNEPLETATLEELDHEPPTAVADAVDVSVIVSVQDEDAEIGDVVDALGGELDRQGRTWEVIFVLDGVGGPLLKRADRLRQEHGKKIKTIVFKNAFGESICLSAAFERARGDYIVTSPHYVQVDPIELGSMLTALDDGADFVTPWRHPRVDPLLNRIQSGAFNWIIRHIIRMEFHDLNCYFRAIRRIVLEDVAVYGDMYRFLPVIAHRHGYSVVEVKVRHIKEWGKAGWFGIGVYLRRALDVFAVMFLTKFTLMPLRFFGPVGGMFAFAGFLITGFLSVEKFIYHESIRNRPLLLGGMMLIVLGVQIIGFGLVGEIIIFSQARNLREYRIEQTYE